ncbi:hypothetical protein B0H14DRAFT_98345 [Mycena olivaceomarginata]|nr:hypothetical protein B0H14DRAFT_98345 [Mycena olivaceomarginata]
MFPRSFFLLLAGAVARVSASGVVCQTSGGSPTTSDARVVANQMGGNGGLTCNDVNAPPGCTQIWRVGTAAANLCRGDDGCISFNEAAQIVEQIADECPLDLLFTYTSTIHHHHFQQHEVLLLSWLSCPLASSPLPALYHRSYRPGCRPQHLRHPPSPSSRSFRRSKRPSQQPRPPSCL